MDALLQIALIIFPAGGVLLTTIFFLRRETAKELRSAQIELKKQRQEYFLPNRVEAYQRAVLLMERIHPNSLVMRLHNPGLPARALQADFLKAIREEYDHNVAQQLFVSPQAWNLVKNSKEETIKIINMAGNQMTETSTGMDLSAKIFEIVAEVGVLPSEITVDYLKKELKMASNRLIDLYVKNHKQDLAKMGKVDGGEAYDQALSVVMKAAGLLSTLTLDKFLPVIELLEKLHEEDESTDAATCTGTKVAAVYKYKDGENNSQQCVESE
jgi:beta-phosphoglucomutase-like phosphatase (HAD superfamily)